MIYPKGLGWRNDKEDYLVLCTEILLTGMKEPHTVKSEHVDDLDPAYMRLQNIVDCMPPIKSKIY